MTRKRLGLWFGIAAGLMALAYGFYTLGSRTAPEPEAQDLSRYGFLLIPVLAAGGGWVADNSGFLAAILLALAAVVALWAFGLTLPVLIFAAIVGGAALLFWLQDL